MEPAFMHEYMQMRYTVSTKTLSLPLCAQEKLLRVHRRNEIDTNACPDKMQAQYTHASVTRYV